MTVNLKNVSGEAVYLGRPDGPRIEADQIIHVEGELAKKQPDDAYLIGEGDDARTYAHSTWKVTAASSKAEPDVPAPTAEENG